MANATSPDPTNDLVPVEHQEEETVDPVAPAPEPKLPSRKDASLKEFMGKMDDYAPIVRSATKSFCPYVASSSHSRRSQMQSQITTSPKLAFHHHHKQTKSLPVSLPSQRRSLSPISLLMPTSTPAFDPPIVTPTTRWET